MGFYTLIISGKLHMVNMQLQNFRFGDPVGNQVTSCNLIRINIFIFIRKEHIKYIDNMYGKNVEKITIIFSE